MGPLMPMVHVSPSVADDIKRLGAWLEDVQARGVTVKRLKLPHYMRVAWIDRPGVRLFRGIPVWFLEPGDEPASRWRS